jgi:phosphatidylinositol alpha-1,6-mannosyltransferase
MSRRRSAPDETHVRSSVNPRVCVVVLNRNGADDILECLESVFACSYADLRVILVDNASEDDSLKRVKSWAAGEGALAPVKEKRQQVRPATLEEIKIDQAGELKAVDSTWGSDPACWPHLTVIRSGSNLGFAGGHNLGISMALRAEFEFVLLLNSDVIVDVNFLGPLVEAAREADVGATGPIVAFHSNPETVWQAGARVHLSRGRVEAMGKNTKVADIAGGPRDVDALVGCALLLKAAALKQVGLIDTDYFLYLEESDWFVRARKLGWRAALVPESKVFHKESALSIQAKAGYSSYYFARNRLYLVKKNRPAYLPLALIWTLRYGILNNVLRRRWSLLAMTLKGLRDFFAGRVGKCESLEHDKVAFPGFMVFTIDYKPQAGGIAEHAHRIALHLARKGVPVCVLAPARGEYREFDNRQPFETYRVPVLPGLDTLLYLFFVFRLVMKLRIGVVYCATSHPCGLICWVLRLLLSFRYTVTIHAHEVLYGGRGMRQTLKQGLKPLQIGVIGAADRVFAVSDFTRRALIDNGVAEAGVTVVPNGIDLEDLRHAHRDDRVVSQLGLVGKPIILTVARLDIHKGHDTVIRALPDILEDVPDAVYVIVGEGPMRGELESLSAAAGVSDHVVFTGHIPRPQVLALYEACSVFVMVSRIEGTSVEGFGIAFLEGGAFSRPVVGGRSGGIPDAVADGVSGILVDPSSPDEVARAVSRVLTDPDLAGRLGRGGYERVASEFTWDNAVGAILRSLESP